MVSEDAAMPKFKPIRQTRVSEEVVAQVKQSILLGEFKAGDKLPSEHELMEQFQVSRAAIREALRALENSGFLMTRQGATGGAYVTELSFKRVSDAFLDLFLADRVSMPELCQVRQIIEPEVARLAARNTTTEYAQRLLKALDDEEKPATSLLDDIETKTAVHFILAEMCGNRFFEALVKSLLGVTRGVVEAVRPHALSMHPAGMHRPIVEAVIAGRPDESAEAMRLHAVEFGETLIEMEKAFRERMGAGFGVNSSGWPGSTAPMESSHGPG
jgi:DNA-binding FadR family transcriptional regulator